MLIGTMVGCNNPIYLVNIANVSLLPAASLSLHHVVQQAYSHFLVHTPGRNRPIGLLVKLHSSRDRRAAVSGSYQLTSTAGLERVFISLDEPLET